MTRGINPLIVINEMNLSVGAFDENVRSIRPVIESMSHYPALKAGG